MLVGFFCAVVCALAPGQVAIGPQQHGGEGFDAVSQITRDGRPIGWYVDNESADQQGAVTALQGQGLILAGVPICCPHRRIAGAVSVYEFYPVGFPSWSRCPAAEGYVLQGSFHWPGASSPDFRQRARMWRECSLHEPRIVVWYRYGPRVQLQAQRLLAPPSSLGLLSPRRQHPNTEVRHG